MAIVGLALIPGPGIALVYHFVPAQQGVRADILLDWHSLPSVFSFCLVLSCRNISCGGVARLVLSCLAVRVAVAALRESLGHQGLKYVNGTNCPKRQSVSRIFILR